MAITEELRLMRFDDGLMNDLVFVSKILKLVY